MSPTPLSNRPASRIVRNASSILRYLLAAMWIASGITKLVDPNAFTSIVTHHHVVSASIAQVAWMLGGAEFLLGLWLIVSQGRQISEVVACLTGSAVLLGFSIYVAHIPLESLAKVGCGCQLGLRRLADSAAASRSWLILGDLSLAVVHVFLAFLLLDSRSVAGSKKNETSVA